MRLGDWRRDLPPGLRKDLAAVIPEELKQGWRTGRDNFGNGISFYAPSLKHYETTGFRNSSDPFFVPVSVTGDSCRLKCEHCRARILRSMHEATTPDRLLELARRLWEQGARGLLLSGGSMADGTVPLNDFLKPIGELKEMGFKVAVHTGLVDEHLARGLAQAEVDVAMIDIIGSEETIRNVYHLKASVADYERSLDLLTGSGVKTAPHVVIGLDFGRIKGEYEALKMISRHPVYSLVLVVIMPSTGTPMQEVAPPPPQQVGDIFLRARLMFPRTPVLLGCARPFGDHKLLTDALALKCGLNGIAYPAEGVTQLAEELGLRPKFSQQCCALIYQDDAEDEDLHEDLAVAGHGSAERDRERRP